MINQHLMIDGSPVPMNATVKIDHFVQVFTVEVRSMTPVTPTDLMNLVNTKYEAMEVNKPKSTAYYKEL